MNDIKDILCDQKFVLGQVVEALAKVGITAIVLDKDEPACDVVVRTVLLSKYSVYTRCVIRGRDSWEIERDVKTIIAVLADMVAAGMARDIINGPLILVNSAITWSNTPASDETRLGMNITSTTNVFAT